MVNRRFIKFVKSQFKLQSTVRLLGSYTSDSWGHICQTPGVIYVRLLGSYLSDSWGHIRQTPGVIFVRRLGSYTSDSWSHICCFKIKPCLPWLPTFTRIFRRKAVYSYLHRKMVEILVFQIKKKTMRESS